MWQMCARKHSWLHYKTKVQQSEMLTKASWVHGLPALVLIDTGHWKIGNSSADVYLIFNWPALVILCIVLMPLDWLYEKLHEWVLLIKGMVSVYISTQYIWTFSTLTAYNVCCSSCIFSYTSEFIHCYKISSINRQVLVKAIFNNIQSGGCIMNNIWSKLSISAGVIWSRLIVFPF